MGNLLVILLILGPFLLTGLYAVAALWLWRTLRLRGMRWARRAPRTVWDDLLLLTLGWPLILGLVLGGVLLLFAFWPLPFRPLVFGALRIALVVAAVVFLHQVVAALLRVSPEGSWLRLPLLRRLALALVLIVAVLVVLAQLGIAVGPLLIVLAALALAAGIAGARPAADLFAGIQLLQDRALEVGQSIGLENGMRGEVLRMGWLRTTLRGPDDVRLLVPNARLLGMVMRNHTASSWGPSEEIVLRVSRLADLDRAQRIAEQVVDRLDAEPGRPSLVRRQRTHFTALHARYAELTVALHGPSWRALPRLRSDYLKALNRAFTEAGIELVE